MNNIAEIYLRNIMLDVTDGAVSTVKFFAGKFLK